MESKVRIIHLSFLFAVLFFLSKTFASPLTLKDVKVLDSKENFTVEYQFDGKLKKKDIELELIKNTVQVNVKNANIKKDKRFDKVKDDLVHNLYSFVDKKDILSLRINYKDQHSTEDFKENIQTSIDGQTLTVVVNDGRSIEKLSAEDKIKQMEDPYSFLKTKLSIEEDTEVKNVINEEEFQKNLENKLVSSDTETTKKTSNKLQNAKVLETAVNEKIDNKNDMPENQIPIFSNSTKVEGKKSKTENTNLGMIMLVVLGLLLGTLMFLKRFAKQKAEAKGHNTIKVLTQHYLGPKKSLAIVRVAGESVLIGITDQSINLIKPLALLDEEVPQVQSNNFNTSLMKADQNLGMNFDFAGEEDTDENDEFSISGIKDVVKSKLKGMKEL